MTTSLSIRQGMLTKTSRRLSTILDDVASELLITPPLDQAMRKTYLHDKKIRLVKLKKNIQAAAANVRQWHAILHGISGLTRRQYSSTVCSSGKGIDKCVSGPRPAHTHVLKTKHEQADQWTTGLLLSHVCKFIDTEAEIQRHLGKANGEQESIQQKSGSAKSMKPKSGRIESRKSIICFFCEEMDHSPRNCPKLTTRAQRLDHMKRNSLCLNCGERNHKASECSKGACRICNKVGHHTSICRQANPLQENGPQPGAERKMPTAAQKPPPRKATRQNFVSSTIDHQVEDGTDDEDVEAVLCMKTTDNDSKDCVLVGEAEVLNSSTQALESVHILLDTGSDHSFVTEDLAKRLGLNNIDTKLGWPASDEDTLRAAKPKETGVRCNHSPDHR
ncbi:zinc knuckle [Cooperia oncophora]